MISDNIRLHSENWCLAQLFSERLLPQVDGSKYRDLQVKHQPAEEGLKGLQEPERGRTRVEHGRQNELNRANRCSQTLNWQSQSLDESVPGPLHTCCGFQLGCPVGLVTMGVEVSLRLLFTRGALSSYFVALLSLDMRTCGQSYFIWLRCSQFISLGGCSFLKVMG